MPSSSKLFTMGVMQRLSVAQSAGSSVSGYEPEFAFDMNPDMWFQTSGTGTFILDIDMGEAVSPNDFALFWRDYNTDHESGSQGIGVYTDDNDDGNYTAMTPWGGTGVYINNTVGDPIDFALSSLTLGAVSKRYWRISFNDITQTLKIAGIYFLKRWEISVGNQWPEDDEEMFETSKIKAAGGREFVHLYNSIRTGTITRHFLFNGDTDYEALRNAFRDSLGDTWPLILQENSVNRLVRFASNTFNKHQIEHGLYNPTVKFSIIPYIQDGRGY